MSKNDVPFVGLFTVTQVLYGGVGWLHGKLRPLMPWPFQQSNFFSSIILS